MPHPDPIIDGEALAELLDLDYTDYEDALDQVAEAASEIVESLLRPPIAHAPNKPAAVIEAALSVGAEIWQARTAAGGQPVSIDFTPGPYRLSVYITRRVSALLAPYLDTRNLVG
jgi:hypothetical protein